MARLPSSGTSLLTPYKSRIDLTHALTRLKAGKHYDAAAVEGLWSKLARINGKWLSDQTRIEVSPIAKTLLSTARHLSDAFRVFGATETGFHSTFDIAAASEVMKYLTLDPTIGTQLEARKVIFAFRHSAKRIAHACMVARAALPTQPGSRGRPAIDWCDDFTSLLVEIASKAGLEPSLHKDRVTNVRGGWLFDAAQALENFLDPAMRSPSAEACGKRLERSLKNLRKSQRQKSTGR